MSNQTRLLRTLRTDITILFFICLGTIICIEFWLKGIPEFFNGGAKLGEIIVRLCLAYISAFIFYFLVVHIKTQKDKANIYNYVRRKVYMVIGSCHALIIELANATGVTLQGDYPTAEELTTICKNINPNSKAPLVIGELGNYANWLQYLDYHKQRSNEATEKIFAKMPFLDTKLVNLLDKVDDSEYFGFLTKIIGIQMSSKDLTNFHGALVKYLASIKQLEVYADKKLKDYA